MARVGYSLLALGRGTKEDRVRNFTDFITIVTITI